MKYKIVVIIIALFNKLYLFQDWNENSLKGGGGRGLRRVRGDEFSYFLISIKNMKPLGCHIVLQQESI